MSKVLPLNKLSECSIDDFHSISPWELNRESYAFKIKKYFSTSVDNQPNNLHHPNTLVHCQTNSNRVLIVVGESWTYGDSLSPYVRACDAKDSLAYRLGNIFSSHLANYLKSDLLLYSEPGNANFDIWSNIQPLIDYCSNYKEVFVVTQLTTPGRDMWLDDRELFEKDRLSYLFTGSNNRVDLNNWLILYDDYYLDWARHINNTNKIKQLVVWKNFNRFHSKNFQDLSVVDYSFMEYAIQFSGRETDISFNQHLDFYNSIYTNSNIELNLDLLNLELEKVDSNYAELSHSMLNNFHPNLTGHWILASLIRNKIDNLFI